MKKQLLIFLCACAFTSVDARLTKEEVSSTIYHTPKSYTAMGSIQKFRELLASEQHKSNKDDLDILGGTLAEFIAHGTIENPKGTYTPPGESRKVRTKRINKDEITDPFKVLLSAAGKLKSNGLASLSDRFNQLYLDEKSNRIQRHIRGALMLASLAENTVISGEKTIESLYHNTDETIKKFAAFSGEKMAPQHHFEKILNPLSVMDEMRNAAKIKAQNNPVNEAKKPLNNVNGDPIKIDRNVLNPQNVAKEEKQEKRTPQQYNADLDAKMKPYEKSIERMAELLGDQFKDLSENILKIVRYFFIYDLNPKDTPTQTDITKKYRELSRIYHPDKNKDDVAYKEFFQDISVGFEVLKKIAKNEPIDLLHEGTWEQIKAIFSIERVQPQQNEQNIHTPNKENTHRPSERHHKRKTPSKHDSQNSPLSFPDHIVTFYDKLIWGYKQLEIITKDLKFNRGDSNNLITKIENLSNLFIETRKSYHLKKEEIKNLENLLKQAKGFIELIKKHKNLNV